MHSLAEFFQTNRVIVYFIYGEAFFILGLAIALQSRKHSQLALARRLWLLAAFGIVHAIYEWGAVFIPIQQTYLPSGAVSLLRVLQMVLGAISFLALFQFGVELVAHRSRRWRWLIAVPGVAFLGWSLYIFFSESAYHTTLDEVLVVGDVFARYGLGVPGALAASAGLFRQAAQVRGMDLTRIAWYFRTAAYAFIIYAGLTAIVPSADFFPAAFLNYDMVLALVGIPVPVFRAGVGAAIAYLIIRGSEIFDVETDRMLEEVAQARAISADRERIGRELHDSIIQSLYAAGLILEDASLSIEEDRPRAQERIRQVISALNQAIRDIRRYILDLRGETNTGDLQASLQEMVRAFRLETLIDAEFEAQHPRGVAPPELTRAESDNILTIAREALTNISKHAQATRVDVKLQYGADKLELDIADNGLGLAENGKGGTKQAAADGAHEAGEGKHQGIRNMRERARILGAELDIHGAPKSGTVVRLVVPVDQLDSPAWGEGY